LRNAGVEFDDVNYAKAALDEKTVRALVAAAGSVGAVVNTRHAIAKEKGWATNPPDADTFAKAVVKEPNLLRRPILLLGKKAIIGFDKAAYAKLK
jgi:arsenate reductase-like glutaredoxin family protein